LDLSILAIFFVVYLGMLLGRIPGLALDRAGIALLGAIALLATGRITTGDATTAIDVPTIALLFGLMIISAQFRLSGFYSRTVRRLAEIRVSPRMLLALLIALVGILSALLANDIVCLAMTPVLAKVCTQRRLNPKPFLLALACAANVGSAATLIGNPQNMLIGQVLHLSFSRYLLDAGVPSILGLALVWWVICLLTAGRWEQETPRPHVDEPLFNRWQTTKGFVVLSAVIILFLVTPFPREIVALAAAGILLCSRRMHSREMLGLVDWQLLVLFIGLFIVNHAMAASGTLAVITQSLAAHGIHMEKPAWLFGLCVVFSNLVSNVPAVMLLLPSASHPLAGPILALSSTLAGNLIVIGSIANIIVIDQARQLGIRITWREHARVGVPVTLLTLTVAAFWLWLMTA